MTHPDTPATYQIRTRERLQEKWAAWVGGRIVRLDAPGREAVGTTLLVTVPDQAALRGVVNKLWDLNLTLISIIQQEPKRSTP
jgi:hypothetical protein